MWQDDIEFNRWLDANGYGTDEFPIDDDILDLMYEAFVAGICFANSVEN